MAARLAQNTESRTLGQARRGAFSVVEGLVVEPSGISVERRLCLVLDILRGATSIADVAHETGMSTLTVAEWRQQFLEGARRGLAGNLTTVTPQYSEAVLLAEIDKLNAKLAQARLRSGRGGI